MALYPTHVEQAVRDLILETALPPILDHQDAIARVPAMEGARR